MAAKIDTKQDEKDAKIARLRAALDDIAHKRMSLMDCQDAAKRALVDA